jgi:hypothetical protein
VLWRNILGSQMSKVGTKLTLAVLPQCWNERTFGPISATTQFDPELTLAGAQSYALYVNQSLQWFRSQQTSKYTSVLAPNKAYGHSI